jgi:hypothetical protein
MMTKHHIPTPPTSVKCDAQYLESIEEAAATSQLLRQAQKIVEGRQQKESGVEVCELWQLSTTFNQTAVRASACCDRKTERGYLLHTLFELFLRKLRRSRGFVRYERSAVSLQQSAA